MPKYRIGIKRKDYEFSFEEENLKNFKEELPDFISFVDEFEKPLGRASRGKRGGRRPPFIKKAIEELIEKEPEWLVEKFPEDIEEKIKTQYGVVGAQTNSVNVALIRFFKKGSLTRKEVQGKYAYSVQSIR